MQKRDKRAQKATVMGRGIAQEYGQKKDHAGARRHRRRSPKRGS